MQEKTWKTVCASVSPHKGQQFAVDAYSYSTEMDPIVHARCTLRLLISPLPDPFASKSATMSTLKLLSSFKMQGTQLPSDMLWMIQGSKYMSPAPLWPPWKQKVGLGALPPLRCRCSIGFALHPSLKVGTLDVDASCKPTMWLNHTVKLA